MTAPHRKAGTMPNPPQFDATKLAEGMHVFSEAVSGLMDAVDAHRADCTRRGYSAVTAEAMALNLHTQVFAFLGHSLTATPAAPGV